MVVILARLYGGVFEVHASLVDAHGCSGLHPCRLDADGIDGLRQMRYGRLGASSASHHLASHVHQSVEECAGSYYDGRRHNLHSPDGAHAFDACGGGRGGVVYEFIDLVLPDVEPVGMVEDVSPLPDEFLSVALRSWRPHGRSLASVEHTKLYGSGIGDDTHASSERIDFAYYLSFCNATHCGVAGHLRYFVHVHRNEASLSAHFSGCVCGFTSGVTTAYNNNIVIQSCHFLEIFGKINKKF